MSGCKPVATPLDTIALKKEVGSPLANITTFQSLIGSLLYLTNIRSDIMYTTSLLSRFMQSPTQVHYRVAKRILRYLEGTKDYGIWYKPTTTSRFLGTQTVIGQAHKTT